MSKQDKQANLCCPICDSQDIILYSNEEFGVDSASHIVALPMSIFLCEQCLTIFKKRNKEDFEVIKKLYETYVLHTHDGCFEQRVAYDKYHGGIEKSEYLLQYLLENTSLQEKGKVLDIGCHFGSFLKKFNAKKPHWSCCGFDVSERYRTSIENISIHSKFITNLETCEEKYDLIILSHVAEHLSNPLETFLTISKLIKEDGIVFIQVNNLAKNLFLPLIFEQHFNFTLSSLQSILKTVGLYIQEYSSQWMPKEFSLIVSKKPISIFDEEKMKKDEEKTVKENINILKNSRDNLCNLDKKMRDIYILGTSYSSKWVAQLVDFKIKCFVDEDENLQHSFINNIEIVSVDEILPSSILLLPFPPEVAQNISNRLSKQLNQKSVSLIAPPFEVEQSW